MTSLLEGAKKLVTRGSDIGARLDGLEKAVDSAHGRVDESVLAETSALVQRSASRLRISADHTIVALAGATGSGKSTTFNALTGLELSAVGVRRPTTSWATACVWGSEGAPELLDWLGIPPRHQVTRDSMLSVGNEKDELDGVILLDLPDHDSTEVSHHLEVDRLVELADMLIWVLDPQKYADAAIHDRYLSKLTGYQDVMLVVLNQIDRVPAERRDAMVDDVRRLLAADGLTGVPVIPVSSREGWGVAELRSEIAKKVASKKVAKARLEADLRAAATTLQGYTGTAEVPTLSPQRVEALEDAFADAAGVPTVVKAVEDSTRLRANLATGWPVTAWAARFKPDPLKRLHLDLGAEGKMLTGAARTSVPQATQVQRARVDNEVRALVDDVTTGFKQNWAHAVRVASVSRLTDVNDRLDRALATTELGADRIPVWANAVRVLQWILILSAVTGAAWLALLMLGTGAGLSGTETPEVVGWPLPLFLLAGGIGLGIVLALVCRLLVSATAKRRARMAEARLRAAIHEVSEDLVVGPVRAELDNYAATRAGIAAALA
ncbi:YfjP family GTPase [Nocardioides jishulii]|uniref:ABC transporter n=1 Tax=Nocardioides jishulii TaxID=2575440 RepID=A0A4V5TLC4_9ACTN|nr:YfjP family GTPase [Nocardioides jishulii]QCX26900.1 ABC transporter [Nocardioides jishulii]TKI61383.1 ABC transporter [Nocardioides jishulii]